MSTFRSIEELVKSLDREKELLKEMFAKRKSLSFRYDYCLLYTSKNKTGKVATEIATKGYCSTKNMYYFCLLYTSRCV